MSDRPAQTPGSGSPSGPDVDAAPGGANSSPQPLSYQAPAPLENQVFVQVATPVQADKGAVNTTGITSLTGPNGPTHKAEPGRTLWLWLVLLLLANVAYAAWSQGALRGLGWGPHDHTEPQRLTQQLHAEQLSLLTGPDLENFTRRLAARQLPCWQLGPLQAAPLASVTAQLEAWQPAPVWQVQDIDEPERWLLFMGPYASDVVLERKRAELQGLGLQPRDLTHPKWGQGLSLGAFESSAQAQQALAGLSKRGVRTARVVRDHPARAGQRLSVWTRQPELRVAMDTWLTKLPESDQPEATSAPRLMWLACAEPGTER